MKFEVWVALMRRGVLESKWTVLSAESVLGKADIVSQFSRTSQSGKNP